MSLFRKNQSKILRKGISSLIIFIVSFSLVFPANLSYAKDFIHLPEPDAITAISGHFTPTLIKGISIDVDNPFKFNFIVDTGDTAITGAELKTESTKLIKYFLASLTTPEDQAWVNLSPYEKERIISQGFGKTTMGRDLLAQDYVLKQISAAISNPEEQLGEKFWDRVHQKAQEQFGSADIPLNTFNKIWIVPQDALVYEKDNTAFVVKSHLKVYLEEDYLALQKNTGIENFGIEGTDKADVNVVSGVTSQIVKDVLIPEIEEEVNTGKTFANLRQIYNSVILATWYKNTLKNSILSKVYVDQSKVAGVNVEDEAVNQEIYNQYVAAFKKGVYNFIREEYDQATQELIPRKYFSGGLRATIDEAQLKVTHDLKGVLDANDDNAMAVGFRGNPNRQFNIEVNALALNANSDLAQLEQAPFVQSSGLEDNAMVSRAVKVAIPNDFSQVLAKQHQLEVDNVSVIRVNGSGGEKTLLNDPLSKYILESTSAGAIGSYYLRGLGKKTPKGLSIKNAGDANALRFIEAETMSFIRSNPEYAIVELASEGLRDGSVSTPVGRIQSASLPGGYIDTATFEFDEKEKGFIKSFDKELYVKTLTALREKGVQILFKITDSLEKTEGLVDPEARNKPTDSWALNSFILDSGEGEFRMPIDDNFRTAGYSYHAVQKADIGPLDLPSVALPKIAKANGYMEGTPGYVNFMNNVTVVLLGPRGFELKDEDSSDSRHAHFIVDALRFKEENGFKGMRVAPVTDGDLMPRLMALTGPSEINDYRNIITLGRSGSAEAEAARAWSKTYEGAHMVSRRVSTKATANNVAYETADYFTDEEIETNEKLGYSEYDLKKVTNDEEEDVESVVSMTSVTGATNHLGEKFKETMQGILHNTENNTITTSTLINDRMGNIFVARVTYRPKRAKLADAVESILSFHADSKAVVDELGINSLNTDSASMEEAVQKGIISPQEKEIFTQIPSNEIPVAISQNFKQHGLTMEDMFVAEVDAGNGKLVPTSYKDMFTNVPTLAGISVASLQALAGSAYSGTLEQIMGRRTEGLRKKLLADIDANLAQMNDPENFGKYDNDERLAMMERRAEVGKMKYGSEIDAAAVKVGRDSLEKIARELDIVIIIGGNEGGFRDDSADMPIGLVINPKGENGKYMYFGDSVEVTNGVKRAVGRPGTSSMIALVPYKMMPSTDGYRTSMAIDKFNPNKPYPVIDPVVTKENSLKKIIGQLAEYLGVNEQELIADLAAHYELAALDRVKNEEMFAQAKELGISTVMREDGDPIFFIRALQGIPSKNGKKVLAISTGGANEHIMALIFASLYKKGYMSTAYTSNTSLKLGEKLAKERGEQGNLNLARAFKEGDKDMQNFLEVDKALDRVRRAGFEVPKSPTTVEEVTRSILLPDSEEISELRKEGNQASLVLAYNTGANSLDWSNLDKYIQPVTWLENEDGSGRVKVSGFFINKEGKVKFFRSSYTTKNVTDARYSIIARNDLMPNSLIVDYDKTRVKFKEMLEKNESDIEIIEEHAKNIRMLLANEPEAKDLLGRLESALEAAQQSMVVDAFVVEAFQAVDKYILGKPSVQMEDDSVYPIVQSAEDLAMATQIDFDLDGEMTKALAEFKPSLMDNQVFNTDELIAKVFPDMEADKKTILRGYILSWLHQEASLPDGQIETVKGGGFKFRNLGGINLNPGLIKMEIKRDGKGIILPLDQQPYFNTEIEGLLPVIINVTPISIPLLLGLEADRQESKELAAL